MENLLKCGRCRSSFYCSKEHQKQHWKKHKLICKEADKAQHPKQKPENPPPSGNRKEPEECGEKISPERADSAALPQDTNTVAPEVGDGAGEDGSNDTAATTTPNGQTSSSPQKLATEYIVPCMNRHGICVVDNFLGVETGLGILENVIALHKTGKFTDGQLVSQKSDSTKDIRGDKITWIEGREAGCEKIRFLMSRMDDLIRHCNGKLGNYTINGRTKVSMRLQVKNTQKPGSTSACLYALKLIWTSRTIKNQLVRKSYISICTLTDFYINKGTILLKAYAIV